MKKFLIAGSSLVAVAAAGSAGAVDVTLGGSIDMGVEFGVGKNKGSMTIGDAYNSISLSLAAAGTTDGGLKYGGSFTLATATEIEFDPYGEGRNKKIFKYTVDGNTDLQAAVYQVSGGQKIDADDIVAVKINSEWNAVSDSTRTAYGYPLLVSSGFATLDAEAICKVAGRAELGGVHAGLAASHSAAATGLLAFGRANAASTKIADLAFMGTTSGTVTAQSGYLPAGRIGALATPGGSAGNKAAHTLILTAGTSNSASGNVKVTQASFASSNAEMVKGGNVSVADDLYNVYMNGTVTPDVTAAAVWAGPFMSVQLRSSSTKMVVGAACLSGIETSDTAVYMDNVTKIVTASDASIFIEGGFGKLTLQTGDYAGAVSAIGDAGDQADIGADGLVAIVEGVGLLGANPYLAVDLAPSTAEDLSTLQNLEILTGGTIDLGGLSAGVDIELANDGGNIGIGAWDLGLDYAMGDMAVSFVIDSANAWGMSASMDVAGFGVDATIYNKALEAHKKSGLFYDVSASTSLNGFGLSLGVDQDMQPTVGLTKSMGGLSIYAGYDAGDEGGKVGATLSF